MPPKPHNIYATERPNRDFSWFSPRPSPPPEAIDLSVSPPTPSPRKPRPTPTTPRRVHKTPSTTMFSITPKPPRRGGGPRTPRIVLQPPPDEPPVPSPKPGPWSDWFPTRDSPPRFWRARKLPDDTNPPSKRNLDLPTLPHLTPGPTPAPQPRRLLLLRPPRPGTGPGPGGGQWDNTRAEPSTVATTAAPATNGWYRFRRRRKRRTSPRDAAAPQLRHDVPQFGGVDREG
ncbi:hypothetical protein B0T18DRAFT_458613 [Schizothecium vesticola]|uniref:Uncharacterized protein n=1 Tax=Schizothecium vesticola TaxID=314040 RepID=A0AA40F751_9PEZI|nr:hypothetical protein B0T18DRAFT_458613 [Schizothecium vesticola]